MTIMTKSTKIKPAYIRRLNKLEKEKGISFKNIEELRKIIEKE